jgi:hypothetical protein
MGIVRPQVMKKKGAGKWPVACDGAVEGENLVHVEYAVS